MSEQLWIPFELEQEKNAREQLFRTNALLNLGGVIVTLGIFSLISLLYPQEANWFMAAILGGYALMTGFSYRLSVRGRQSWAIAIYLVSLTAALLLLAYSVNGIKGPFAIGLITVPLLAQVFSGKQVSRWAFWGVVILYLGISALESLAILEPIMVSSIFLNVGYGVLFMATIGTTFITITRFETALQQILSTTQEHNQKLLEDSKKAEKIILKEREETEKKEKAIYEIRLAVKKYTTFLEQVITGDYSARLSLKDIREDNIPFDLRTLGEYINTAVEALAGALNNLQAVQRRYVRGAWESYTAIDKHQSYRYSKKQGSVVADANIKLPALQKDSESKSTESDQDGLILPIELRGEVIGVMVARDEEKKEWSKEDIALATAINDQLAQTIENLRLLEETQRRAERERLTSRVATSMRETLDVDTILQTAVREMRENMNLHDVMIKLKDTSEEFEVPIPDVENMSSE